jgi:putative oxidoreductase
MNIVLWVIQAITALAFLAAGGFKSTQPIDTLAKSMSWVKSFPTAFVRFIAICEVLGGIGLIVPELTHILPWLTIVAAAGLVIIMIGAVVYHIVRKEYANIAPSLVLLILSAIILYGRWILVPIH